MLNHIFEKRGIKLSFPPALETQLLNSGYTGSKVSMTNLVNNSGVIASDVTGVGTARGVYNGAAGYSTSA